jgi:hypothetical protein
MRIFFRGFSWKIAITIWMCFLGWGAIVTLVAIAFAHLPLGDISPGVKIVLTLVMVVLLITASEPLRDLLPNLWSSHFRGEQDWWWVIPNCALLGLAVALASGILVGLDYRSTIGSDRES